jgi:hypothetical protein
VDKRQEAERTKEASVQAILEGVKDANIFIDGKEVTSIEKKIPKERVKEVIDILVRNVFSKSSYVTLDYESDTDILRILRSDDLEKFGIGKSDTNKLALSEVLNYISIRDEKNNTVVLKDLKEHFMKKPYGWKDMTISGKYAEEKRYPGKEDIEKYAAFLNRVQGVTDSSAFLKTMADEKNERFGMRQKVEPVMAFFEGPQVGIFRRISKKIENFKRNAQFLNDEARSHVDEIESILTSAEPYSKIKLLPQLESGIEASLQNSLFALKQDVQTRLKAMVSDEKEPQINADERRLNALSVQIIEVTFEVSNFLGTGFLEKVYENSLNFELNLRGLKTFQQAPLKVFYKDELVGDYIADILVENEIIIEVKAVNGI